MIKNTYNNLPIKLAPYFQAISHPARIQILIHLVKYNNCPASSISAQLPLAQSTVSAHLKKLRESKLIKGHSDGNCMCYSLNSKQIEFFNKYFFELLREIEQLQSRNKCIPTKQLD